MPSRRWKQIFAHLYGKSLQTKVFASNASAQKLEHELRDRFRQLYEYKSPVHSSWWRWNLRFSHMIVATVVGLVLIVGACQMPVNWELVLGQQMELALADEPDVSKRIQELTKQLEEIPGIEQISVQVRKHGGPLTYIQLEIWGEDLQANDLQNRVAAFSPEWALQSVTIQPLKGTVHTSLGQKIGHDLFNLALDMDDVETARQHVLEELAAQGVDGEVDIQIEDQEDGRRRIEVRVRKEEQVEDSS